MGYLALFLSAFIAATLLPAASEGVLVLLATQDDAALWLLWAVASTGNILGATVNWALGMYCTRFVERRWFPFSPGQLEKASQGFAKYGQWSLLFAWLPIIGDPLTFAAGVLRVRIAPFLILVGIGKAARYGVILLVVKTMLS